MLKLVTSFAFLTVKLTLLDLYISGVMIDGAFFIDSDPKYFRVVLNYLRRGKLLIDDDISLEALKYEASYFGLVNLEEELNKRLGLEGKCQR